MGAPLASMLFGFLVRDYLVPRLVNNRPGCGQTLHQDIRHINPRAIMFSTMLVSSLII